MEKKPVYVAYFMLLLFDRFLNVFYDIEAISSRREVLARLRFYEFFENIIAVYNTKSYEQL